MRIVVMSDSHKRVGTLLDIVERHIDNADMFIFLGDIDSDFDDVLSVYPQIRYRRVAGNNEWYSPYELSGTVVCNGKKLLYCHGHTFHVKHGYGELVSYAKRIGADICLFGHTHTQYSDYDDGFYIVNPGAVRNGEYAIIDIVDKGVMIIKSEI